MDVLRFIANYWHDILVAIALLAGVGVSIKRWWPRWKAMPDAEKVAYVKRLLQNLLPIAINLVTKAEVDWGGGTGKLKRSYVLDQLYSRIPDEFKPYVTVENLDVILDKALEEAKAIWEKNEKVKALVSGV